MKIVYYLPALYGAGGLERIITFKANYLAEHWKGSEIYILTSEQMGRSFHYKLSEKVKHLDLDVLFDWPFNQSYISKLFKYPYRYWLFKKRFTKTLMDLRPDITISTLRRELNFISSIHDGSIKIGEFHVIRHSYGVGSEGNEKAIIGLLKKYWAKTFLKHLQSLSKVVVLTHEEKKFWPELSNICVIPNPIAISSNQLSTCSQKHIMAAGRYSDEKGFDLLIESWSIVSKRHPDWKLHIYGEGDLKEKFTKLIDELQLNNNCLLHHTVSNIADKYCMSSIFVLSSRYEGFGLVLAEAMSCGIPCVSFDCPHGPSDIIKDYEDGLLVEKENIKELADKICYLIENENVRIKMGHKARENVKRFLPENVMPQWKNLFESLTYSSK